MVQKGLSSRNIDKAEARSDTSPSLLTGLIKCKKCGKNMQIMTGKSGKYKYYRCSTKIGCSVELCDCPNIPKVKIEQLILDKICGEILTTDRVLATLSELREALSKSTVSESKRIRILQSDAARTKERINILYEQIGDRKIDLDSTLTEHIESQQQRISSFTREIDVLKKRQSLPIKDFGKRHVASFIKAVRENLENPDSQFAKSYLQAIVKEIRVTRSEVTVVGSNFNLVSTVSRWCPSTPNIGVPRHFSEWRARKDSNLRPPGS